MKILLALFGSALVFLCVTQIAMFRRIDKLEIARGPAPAVATRPSTDTHTRETVLVPGTHATTTEIRSVVLGSSTPSTPSAPAPAPSLAVSFLDASRAIATFWRDLEDISGLSETMMSVGTQDAPEIRAAILERTILHLGLNPAGATAFMNAVDRLAREKAAINNWYCEESIRLPRETEPGKPESPERQQLAVEFHTKTAALGASIFQTVLDPSNRLHRHFCEHAAMWHDRLPSIEE